MKSTSALLILPLIGMPIASSQGLADQGDGQDPLSIQQSSLGEVLIVAQADSEEGDAAYLQRLELILKRDDFAAAKEFVDDLAENTDISPTTLRSLRNRIRSVKTARLIDYAEKIRKAIADSDMEAVNDYSQRMRKISSAGSISGSSPKSESEPLGSVEISVPRQQAGQAQNAAVSEKEKPNAVTVETIRIQQLRAAPDEDRLLPPAIDDAFDLATAKLAEKPDDAVALDILDDAITRQQSKVLASLDSGRPEAALALSEELVEAVAHLDVETSAASSSYRSSTLRWAERIKPDIVAGLITSSERAIGQWNLTIAPQGRLSAEGYIDLLAKAMGQDHDEVQRLAHEILDRYQGLIDHRLSKSQYERASTLNGRMQAVAKRFGIPTEQIEEQGRYIATLPARQQQHDQLLLQATQLRDQGQLIEPAGANALEFAAKAVRLAANPAAADKVFNDVIFEQRLRIDRMINTGRLEEAARQLQQLGTLVEQVGAEQIERANQYYAEADRVLERAVREKEQQRSEAAKKNESVAAAPPDAPETNDASFTFINPF
ncbi:MAG: hypothetical protein ACR2QF_17450 [Geminicoccaceae bacterium]